MMNIYKVLSVIHSDMREFAYIPKTECTLKFLQAFKFFSLLSNFQPKSQEGTTEKYSSVVYHITPVIQAIGFLYWEKTKINLIIIIEIYLYY